MNPIHSEATAQTATFTSIGGYVASHALEAVTFLHVASLIISCVSGLLAAAYYVRKLRVK